MRHALSRGFAAGALVLLALPGLLMAQQHGHGHGDHERSMHGMMDHAMDACPMAGMMEAILQHADELELTEEQIALFEEFRDQHQDLRAAMRQTMESVHETLTPEQMEMVRDTFRQHMHGMMHGEGHGMHEGEMEGHSEKCPMMRMMKGGPEEGHPHSR